MLPPDNISDKELWIQLSKTDRPWKIIDMPDTSRFKLPDGSPAPCAIRILTGEEIQECIFSAEKYVQDAYKRLKIDIPKRDDFSDSYRTALDNREFVEILYRACRNPEDIKKPFFVTGVNSIAKVLTNQEIIVIYNEYLILQNELGPIVNKMEAGEMNIWIEKLARGGTAYFLGSLSAQAQTKLIQYMACQLTRLQTDKSSATLPQEENIND
jgi:hypothetical protein